MCFFVPEKGHPYPGLAMTGIVTLFKNLAKFGIIRHIATLKDRYTSSEASPQTDPAAAGMRIIIPLLEAK